MFDFLLLQKMISLQPNIKKIIRMKNILSICFITGLIIFVAACQKDEDSMMDGPLEPIDELIGSYDGTYGAFSCGFPQDTLIEAVGSQAIITKLSDTEINVRFANTLVGSFMQFDATMSSDTSFAINSFVFESDSLVGNGFFNDDLRVLLGKEDCVIFGTNPALFSFIED